MSRRSESRPTQIRHGSHDDALIDRVRKLSSILPAMAQDVAVARRDAARLRRENLALRGRLMRLEEPTPPGETPAAEQRGSRQPVSRCALCQRAV
jgi:hypothetical protein